MLVVRLLALFPASFGFAVLLNEAGTLSPALLLIGVLPLLLGLAIALKGLPRNWLRWVLGPCCGLFGGFALIYLILDAGGPPTLPRLRPGSLIVEGKRVTGEPAEPYRLVVRLGDPRRLTWASSSHPGEAGSIEMINLETNSTCFPMDWSPGDQKLNGRVLWFSPRALQQVRMGGRPEWLTNPRGAAVLTWLAPGYRNGPGTLTLVKRTSYWLRVDGRGQRVPVLKVRDGKSNSYWVLDDDENPLILKMVPNRFTLGFLFLDGLFLWTPLNYTIWNDSYRVIEVQSLPRGSTGLP